MGDNESSSSPDQTLTSAASDPNTQDASGSAGSSTNTCGPGDPGTPPNSTPAPMAHIAVTVNDPTGVPIQGVNVSVDGKGWAGVTDGNGNFDFGDVNSDTYTVNGQLGSAKAIPQTQFAPPGTDTQYTLVIPYTVTCQWVTTTAYCGDNVNLQVTCTPTPPNGNVSINVMDKATGNSLTTLTAAMTAGSAQATWVAKAYSANWRTDQVTFSATVTTVNAVGMSSNQFTFKNRPTAGWETVSQASPQPGNGFGPPGERYDRTLEANQVHYKIKFRTQAHTLPCTYYNCNTGKAGAALDATKQANAKTLIETVWNNGFSSMHFHRTGCQRGKTCNCTYDCCKVGFHLDIVFVDSGENVLITIHPQNPPGQAQIACSMGWGGADWADPPFDPASAYPHETGHVMGQYDEYPTGATDQSGVEPADATSTDPNLMSTGGNTTLKPRHYRQALAYLNSKAGDTYETITS